MGGKFIVLTYRKKCPFANSIGGRTFRIYCFHIGQKGRIAILTEHPGPQPTPEGTLLNSIPGYTSIRLIVQIQLLIVILQRRIVQFTMVNKGTKLIG